MPLSFTLLCLVVPSDCLKTQPRCPVYSLKTNKLNKYLSNASYVQVLEIQNEEEVVSTLKVLTVWWGETHKGIVIK